MTSFLDNLNQQRQQFQAGQPVRSYEQHVAELYIVSGDSSGADPSRYLDPETVQVCTEFIQEAANFEFPNSEPLTHSVLRLGKHVRIERAKDMRHPLDANPSVWRPRQRILAGNYVGGLLMRTDWKGEGYRIGKVNTAYEQGKPTSLQAADLVLCSDGLLRCMRSEGAFPLSRGSGFGNLPDPNIAKVEVTRSPFTDRNGRPCRNPNGAAHLSDNEYFKTPADSLAEKFARILKAT